MYDSLSTDYDRFVNWPARLASEMPFLERHLREVGARSVLDAACGTGQHAIALAGLGLEAAGADLSPGMVSRAEANARAAGVPATFRVGGFGELARAFGRHRYDALLCLGNSLPHVLAPATLAKAVADFMDCIRPGGLLIIQNRNFDAVLRSRERWMEPQSHREGEAEWIFLRFYDFEPDGLLSFHVITLHRRGDGQWNQTIGSTRLWPQTHRELMAALASGGYKHATAYGDMRGAAFDPAASTNLVVVARAPDPS